MKTSYKVFTLCVFVSNGIYLYWLFFHIMGIAGVLLFMAEALIVSLTLLFILNHWTARRLPRRNICLIESSLDIFIPVVDEPVAMIEKTLAETVNIRFPAKKIYLLDDGPYHHGLIKRNLCHRYGATYLGRAEQINAKAGNLNYGLSESHGDFILVLDADQVPYPDIAESVMQYFAENSRLAFITFRQQFDVPPDDFNHDILFYEHMQTGKDIDNSAVSTGSGVIYRRYALDAIGGFQTWNIVEDLYTSYIFHRMGWKSLYINTPATLGTAPLDLRSIYKQRGNWALDTFRLFFRRSPFLVKGLSFRQRLHYTETAWAYLVSAIAIPILFTLPALSLFLTLFIIDEPQTYVLLRTPSLLLILIFYYELSGKTFSCGQFWASLSFVYLKALFLSVLPGKPTYRVTKKLAGPNRRDIFLIIPHLLFVILGLSAVFWRIFLHDHMVTFFTAVNFLWISLMVFWFVPIIRKGFLLE